MKSIKIGYLEISEPEECDGAVVDRCGCGKIADFCINQTGYAEVLSFCRKCLEKVPGIVAKLVERALAA